MGALTASEQSIVERARGEPMLDQVLEWSAVNSGSRNLSGLTRIAGLLADAFAALPGEPRLGDPAPVEAVDANGKPVAVENGKNLQLVVRPGTPVQLLFTSHMGTVFGQT
ncbi:MAG: hydrolase, partial [Sphingomicrobium sp.]